MNSEKWTGFDIKEVLRYNKNFNFVIGARSVGKTYTTLKFLIESYLNRGKKFVYLVRTQTEKKNRVLEKALSKVLAEQFSSVKAKFTFTDCIVDNVVMCSCYALSEVFKIKKLSFDAYYYIVFDEFILENSTDYLKDEVGKLLNLYHTMDRDMDRVKLICLGNSISKFNPYLSSEIFKLEVAPEGKAFVNEFCCCYTTFSRGTYLQKSSKFSKMIEGGKYDCYNSSSSFFMDTKVRIGFLHESDREVCKVIDGIFLWYDGLRFLFTDLHNETNERHLHPLLKKRVAQLHFQGYTEFKSYHIFEKVKEVFKW